METKRFVGMLSVAIVLACSLAWSGAFSSETAEKQFRSGTFRLSAIGDSAARSRNMQAVRRMPGEDVNAAWIYDSTLNMPFALVVLPYFTGYSVEGNVAWEYMPPVPMYSMWIRIVNSAERIIVEMALPVAAYREPWNAAGPPLRHDAAGVLRTFVRPILAALSPNAEIGEICERPDFPLLEAARLDLAKNEKLYRASGREARDSKVDAAEMTVTTETFQTRFSVAAWSFLFERESDARLSSLGGWSALLCVTSPAGKDVPDENVRELLNGIRINPEWYAKAESELAELSAIEESPPFYLPEEKERWNAMNRSGVVLVPFPGDRYPEILRGEYVPPHPKRGVTLAGSRYTYVNAAIDGCFLGFNATEKSVDIENIGQLVLFTTAIEPLRRLGPEQALADATDAIRAGGFRIISISGGYVPDYPLLDAQGQTNARELYESAVVGCGYSLPHISIFFACVGKEPANNYPCRFIADMDYIAVYNTVLYNWLKRNPDRMAEFAIKNREPGKYSEFPKEPDGVFDMAEIFQGKGLP